MLKRDETMWRAGGMAALVFLGWGCGTGAGDAARDPEPVHVLVQALVPPRGGANTLDVGSWNIEWFGSTGNGPADEALQRENAYDVIAGADLDIWGVAEVVSTADFNALLAQLPGYAGFLANASNVTQGSAFYSSGEQKVGILYKTALATVLSSQLILTESDYEFGTRPPLQVTLRVSLNGHSEDVVVIVLHAKCCDDNTSWQRRRDASSALKSYLDSTYPTQKVWVIGDFNDDLDTSITAGQPSPYANFSSDGADYRFPTVALSNAGVPSTVGYPDTIDHHLVTNEAAALLVSGSVEAYRVDQFISDYGETTSDHFPVISRYTWSGSSGGEPDGGSGSGQVILNEICANEPGSDTAGEFVELVNVGTSSVALGGWTLADSSATRHTFASGSSLAPGAALVVFGGAGGIPSGVPQALTASTGSLSLANGSDGVTLRNSAGTTIQSFAYGSALANSDGVSMNRSQDGGASAAFVKHDTLSSLPRSPGARVTGAAW